MKVFWPTKGLQAQAGQLVGWAIGDTIVVVGVVGEVSVESWLVCASQPQASLSTELRRSDDERSTTTLDVVGRARIATESLIEEGGAPDLTIWLDAAGSPVSSRCGLLCRIPSEQAHPSRPIELILFSPPDPTRLRFFSSKRQSRPAGLPSRKGLDVQDGYASCRGSEPVDEMQMFTPLVRPLGHRHP